MVGCAIGMAGAIAAFMWLGWRFYSAGGARDAMDASLALGLAILAFLISGLGFSASLY